MTSAFRLTLSSLAEGFAAAIVTALHDASVEDILELSGGLDGDTQRDDFRRVRLQRPIASPTPAEGGARGGRLPRRSREDILRALARVVALVKSNRGGLRAEQIRAKLGLQAKELPRVLHEGLATKALRAQGRKRATTYTAT